MCKGVKLRVLLPEASACGWRMEYPTIRRAERPLSAAAIMNKVRLLTEAQALGWPRVMINGP